MLVNVPLPVMLPKLDNVTVPTVSLKLPRLRTALAPSIVTAPVEMTLFAPKASVPALTVVRPV